jgi:hypothetical protein
LLREKKNVHAYKAHEIGLGPAVSSAVALPGVERRPSGPKKLGLVTLMPYEFRAIAVRIARFCPVWGSFRRIDPATRGR